MTYVQQVDMWDVARPRLQELVAKTGESSSIAELDGSDIVYVARVAVPKLIALVVRIGTKFPAAPTSLGKVLLAGLSDQRCRTGPSGTVSLGCRAAVAALTSPELARRPCRGPRPRMGSDGPAVGWRNPLDRGSAAGRCRRRPSRDERDSARRRDVDGGTARPAPPSPAGYRVGSQCRLGEARRAATQLRPVGQGLLGLRPLGAEVTDVWRRQTFTTTRALAGQPQQRGPVERVRRKRVRLLSSCESESGHGRRSPVSLAAQV